MKERIKITKELWNQAGEQAGWLKKGAIAPAVGGQSPASTIPIPGSASQSQGAPMPNANANANANATPAQQLSGMPPAFKMAVRGALRSAKLNRTQALTFMMALLGQLGNVNVPISQVKNVIEGMTDAEAM